MRVYKDYSPLDKLGVDEAREAHQMIVLVSLALVVVLVAGYLL